MTTVREFWGLVCPKCRRDDCLQVGIEALVLLLPDGTLGVGDDEWGQHSPCGCTACNHWETVKSFDVSEGGQS